MERWAIIYNPTAGSYRQEHLQQLQAALAEAGIGSEVLQTEAPGHATELARSVKGVQRVAVYGGDGTLSEAATGLLGRGLPLAFLPGGSGNSMARELGMPKHPLKALPYLLRGEVRPIHPGTLDGLCFLGMAGFGFDGLAIHLISKSLKNNMGGLGYIATGFRCLVHRHPTFSIETEDGRIRRGLWGVASRSATYGGVMRIHPQAHLEHERLGFTATNGWMLLPFGIGRLLLRIPVRGPGLEFSFQRRLRVRSDVPIHAHLDGNYHRQGTEFEVGISEQTLPFCFPKVAK